MLNFGFSCWLKVIVQEFLCCSFGITLAPRGSDMAMTCNARNKEDAQVMFCLWARARSLVIFHGLSNVAMRSFKLCFVTKMSSSKRRALLLFLCNSCDHAACCVSVRCWLALLRCR
jgi:hypothetical protein